MESRSVTSSPDPLGPPGDAEYLISSPLKPLSDYRHVMSSPKPRTPSIQTTKKTNNKSSQPVRLQDIVMSATPTPGGNGENRLSPTKSTMHSENNLSPWRIRVTVEAEHEDDIDNGNGAHMKSLSGAKTTKVPLKKETGSPSPKKKRGRPRKSDASPGNLTPSKTSRNTPRAKTDSGGKRKRAGPRKSLPDSDVAESIEGGDRSDSASAKSRGDSLFDIAVDQNAGSVAQSSNYDDFEEDVLLGSVSSNNSSPRASKKRLSNNPSLPARELGNELDENTRLTPTKQPSSGRKRAEVSPENTTHAGHTPGPRARFYPTPTTSSSLVEDEHHIKPAIAPNASFADEMLIEEADEMVDVTHGHRDFDTIMESEGFSMVSLDTLPSAKQHVDSTSKIISQTSNSEANLVNPPAPVPPHIKQLMEASSLRPSPKPQSLQNLDKSPAQTKHTPAVNNNSSPKQPPPPAQAAQLPALTTKKPIPRLARVVRSGIALQGVLDRRGRNSKLRSPFSSPSQSGSKSPADRKKRLDDLFRGFDIETQRELRAGLRFGEELARRQREAEAERRNEEARRQSETRFDTGDEMEQNVIYPKLPMSDFEAEYEYPLEEENDSQQGEGITPATPIRNPRVLPEDIEMPSEMLRREEEWQREREAISREIQMANSSQVIVIDSDDDGDDGDKVEQGQSGNSEEAPEDYGGDSIDEDDEYEDIWQLEARDPDSLGESTSFVNESELEVSKPRRSGIPSPWKRGEDVDYSQDVGTAPSLFWGSHSQKGQPVLSNVETQMKKLREQEVDISALLREQAAQSRVFYEDDDKPASAQKRSPDSSRKKLKPRTTNRNSQARSSPFRYSKADAHLQSQPKTSPEKTPPNLKKKGHPVSAEPERESSPEEDNYPRENEDLPHYSSSERPSEEQHSPMRESPEQPAPDTRPSPSWFRSRLTSLTPNWLKSPAVEKSKPSSPPSLVDLPEVHDSPEDLVQASDSLNQPQHVSPIHHSPPPQKEEPKPRSRRSTTSKGLATSGYFTNDHYSLLRRLYRQAKASPELFPYNPTPKRSEMLGKWMWSADGVHSRPITELQIAIVDRFIQELIHNSTRNQFEHEERQLGWSEEELVRRLFSIIVGERVRKERKLREAQMNGGRRDGVRRRHVEMEQ